MYQLLGLFDGFGEAIQPHQELPRKYTVTGYVDPYGSTKTTRHQPTEAGYKDTQISHCAPNNPFNEVVRGAIPSHSA
jgi:hypothetical protein